MTAWQRRASHEKNQEVVTVRWRELFWSTVLPCSSSHIFGLFSFPQTVSGEYSGVLVCSGYPQGHHQLSFHALQKVDEQKSESHLLLSLILWKHNCNFFLIIYLKCTCESNTAAAQEKKRKAKQLFKLPWHSVLSLSLTGPPSGMKA